MQMRLSITLSVATNSLVAKRARATVDRSPVSARERSPRTRRTSSPIDTNTHHTRERRQCARARRALPVFFTSSLSKRTKRSFHRSSTSPFARPRGAPSPPARRRTRHALDASNLSSVAIDAPFRACNTLARRANSIQEREQRSTKAPTTQTQGRIVVRSRSHSFTVNARVNVIIASRDRASFESQTRSTCSTRDRTSNAQINKRE